MRKINFNLRVIALLGCLLTLFSVCLVSCGGNNSSQSANESYDAPDYSALDLDRYIKLGEYKGLTIDVNDGGANAPTLLWNEITRNAEVIKYPDDAVFYYTDQATRRYMHYAQEGGLTYGELLDSLDITENDIEEEAQDLVKNDLVAAAIIEKENIELSTEEIETLFDRYAEKYAEIYGYSKEYVKDNLTNEIYSSMLYDKMMEYLMINNNLVK